MIPLSKSLTMSRSLVLALTLFLVGLSPVRAQEPVQTQEPSVSQLAAARSLVVASGIGRSFEPMVPQLEQQLIQMVTKTRPELAKDLAAAIQQVKPEIDKKKDVIIGNIAAIYAKYLTEAEMKDAVAFFTSASGKKYVSTQPYMLDQVVTAMDSWTQTLSNDLLTMVRVELKKKGIDF